MPARDLANHKFRRPAQERGSLGGAVMLRWLVLRKQKNRARDALKKKLAACVISLVIKN